MHLRVAVRAAAAALLASLSTAALAVDIGEGKLTVHGSGGWAYSRTDENFYFADDDGDYDNAMFDLALAARPVEQLVISAQLGFDSDEVALEWAFAEWRLSDRARFRVGQVQQPLGNYAEIRFVGTARPFFELPTSVYGPADVGAASYYGVGATGDVHFAGDWSFQYDVYAGALSLETYEPFQALEPGGDPTAVPELGTMLVENIFGSRLSLVTPIGLVARASGYLGSANHEGGEGEDARYVGGLSLFYRGERLWGSVEGFGMTEPGSESQLSGYAELAYFLTSHLQVAARYDLARTELDDVTVDSPLLRHDEAAIGLNWWFNPDFVLKVSAHYVEGTRFVAPGEGEIVAEDHTNLVFAGAQFTF
jgi:hypothetical protein